MILTRILEARVIVQIDREGHVVDLSRNMGKLSIIEQEFRAAEKLEQQRLREEDELRVRTVFVPLHDLFPAQGSVYVVLCF